MTLTLETENGTLRGALHHIADRQVATFRAIPYAAPPVGKLRWAAPVDPAKWDGTRDCTGLAPAALQQFHNDWFMREGYTPGHYDSAPPLSEDCLYLNIAMPTDSVTAKPVYVWFHGGGLTNGFAVDAPTDPKVLASKGIIVISVAHRLNVFGYLALPQLRAEQGKSGNYGFLDQLKAMEWIYRNIASFGGDPENITVGGQSGGAQKAAALVATPAGRNRIRNVVSVSGLKWKQPLVDQSLQEQRGQALLEKLGIAPDAPLDQLRAMDAAVFVQSVDRSLLPDDMVQDDVLPFSDLSHGITLHGQGVNWMNGIVMGEADPFAKSVATPEYTPPTEKPPLTTVAGFDAHFGALLGPLAPVGGMSSMVGVTDNTAWVEVRKLACLGLAGSERTNISRNLMLNRLFGQFAGGGRVYNYLWSHRIPASPTDDGTSRDPSNPLGWHGSDTWYMFGTLQDGVSPNRPWRDNDHDLAHKMTNFVVNFVKKGDPNGTGLPKWPEATDNLGYIEVTDSVDPRHATGLPLEVLIRTFVEKEYNLTSGGGR